MYSIKLFCKDCDNGECSLCPQGTYLSETSMRGCIREVSEQDYIQYFHDNNEVLPFLHQYNNYSSIYTTILNNNYKIYNCKVIKTISNNGTLYNFI